MTMVVVVALRCVALLVLHCDDRVKCACAACASGAPGTCLPAMVMWLVDWLLSRGNGGCFLFFSCTQLFRSWCATAWPVEAIFGHTWAP